jgi:uncharacterized protein Smg (DUF494 family)
MVHSLDNNGEQMERHIVEILVILMREYPEGAIRPDEFEPLANDLIGLGYTQQEIEAALFWYYNRQELRAQNRGDNRFEKGAFRFLHEAERAVITPEAYGYLIELQQLELITLSEMDAIIERAVMIGGRKVDIEEIKMFIAAMITDQTASFSPAMQNYLLKTPTDKVH